ncbi:MAG: M60 family metallopeptidase [Tepidisphaerales bacterium]
MLLPNARTDASRPGLALPRLLFLSFLAVGGAGVAARGVPGDRITPPAVDGLATVAAPGLPGALAVWGTRSGVVLTAPNGRDDAGSRGRLPVMAAAEAEDGAVAGRVVVLAHDGYLDERALGVGETAELLQRAVVWAGRGVRPRVATAGVDGRFRQGLEGRRGRGEVGTDDGFRPTWLEVREGGWDALEVADVLLVRGDAVPPEVEEAVRAFLARGGGMVVAVTGWGWQQVHPGRNHRTELVVNRLLRPFGIAITDATSGSDGDGKLQVVLAAPADGSATSGHALDALAALPKRLAGDAGGRDAASRAAAAAADIVLLAAGYAPETSRFGVMLSERLADLPERPYPTPQRPLTDRMPLERVAHAVDLLRLERLPVSELVAHPASAAFPGGVAADAPRVCRAVRVDLSRPRWHSTGLYAPPGAKLTVRLRAGPGSGVHGVGLRIGPHTDDLRHLPTWKRPPQISRHVVLSGRGEERVGSPFGGLIYVDVPAGRSGVVDVEIDGAVEAPLFVLGETTAEQWQTARMAAGPWAELVVPGRVVLTTTSEAIRELEDPTEVLEHWKAVLDAMAELAGIAADRRVPERIVADVQISAGYMHSGYPIMTHLDVARAMVDLPALRTLKGGWGFYHELGHNHQRPEWTFDGTVEVTCNLFVHYVFEKVVGMSALEAAERAIGPSMRRLIDAHLAAPDFERWKAEPFLALAMYAQLHTHFGWGPFEAVFREYAALPPGERPRTDDEKRDQWLVRLSRAVGRDLGPFFERWGVPVSAEAKAQVAGMPVWQP